MIFMLFFIFIFNAVFAMGMKALLEDDASWIRNTKVKIVLLIPPVAFALVGVILIYGTIMTLYGIVKNYFQN